MKFLRNYPLLSRHINGNQFVVWTLRQVVFCRFLTSGESYKQFTLVFYDSRVVIWGIFKSGTTLES